jgi:parallel beta-helix repeat protein
MTYRASGSQMRRHVVNREESTMGKRVQGLAKAVFAVVLAMTWVTGAGAQVISIHACQTLTTAGATYRLTDDIFACGDCLIVAANRITIDLQGFGIVQEIGCFSGSGITDGGVAREQIVVKNGVTFSDEDGSFDYGIDLRATIRTEVRTFGTIFNNIDGIAVGNRTLVKDCLSLLNLENGISAGNFAQVQECGAYLNGFAGGDDLAGIRVGDRCLITQNEASGNVDDGILTGASCTVTHNTASFNESGISVEGTNSLVSHNTTNDNYNEGIEVQCPGTVTHNHSSGNGEDYVFEGPGCFQSNNN